MINLQSLLKLSKEARTEFGKMKQFQDAVTPEVVEELVFAVMAFKESNENRIKDRIALRDAMNGVFE